MTEHVIFKYAVNTLSAAMVPFGERSRILQVGYQQEPVVWVEHEIQAGGEMPVFTGSWEVLIVATGVLVAAGWDYISSVQMVTVDMTEEGPTPRFVVWHMYSRVYSGGVDS